MQTALGLRLAPGAHPLANIGQVFEHQHATRGRRLHKLFGQHMITVAPETGLRAPQVAQVAFGTLAAARLQAAFEPEIASFCRLPGFFPQKLVVGGDSRVCQAEINTNHRISRWARGSLQCDHHMQPPPPVLMLEQISRIDRQPPYFAP